MEQRSLDLLIVNGRVVTDEETRDFDIAVKNGKVYGLGPRGQYSSANAAQIIDAEGAFITVCQAPRLFFITYFHLLLGYFPSRRFKYH